MSKLSAMQELRNFIRDKHESGIYELMTVDLLTLIEYKLLEKDDRERRKIAEDCFDAGNYQDAINVCLFIKLAELEIELLNLKNSYGITRNTEVKR